MTNLAPDELSEIDNAISLGCATPLVVKMRAHQLQLERDLNDANTTIAALREACTWKGFSMSVEATADKLRDEGYRAVPDYLERIQAALRLVTPRVHPDGVAALERMADESAAMQQRLDAVRQRFALDEPTPADALGVRVEELVARVDRVDADYAQMKRATFDQLERLGSAMRTLCSRASALDHDSTLEALSDIADDALTALRGG